MREYYSTQSAKRKGQSAAVIPKWYHSKTSASGDSGSDEQQGSIVVPTTIRRDLDTVAHAWVERKEVPCPFRFRTISLFLQVIALPS